MLSRSSRIPTAAASQLPMEPRVSSPRGTLSDSVGDQKIEKQIGGLVLTRHVDESIMIGDNVEVQVVGIKSGTTRLKIVAPRSIAVHRREVYDAIQAAPPDAAVVLAPRKPAVIVPGKAPGGLVLTRSVDQSIMIGDDVEIAVVEIRPTTVKLKISALKTIPVHRREVFDAIQADQV